jgi:heptosyltransferase-2
MSSRKIPTGTPGKILIIRLSSIGDILLSTPIIRQVRNTYPTVQIDYIVKDIYKDLLHYNPHLNELYSVHLDDEKIELPELKNTLKKRAYDVVLDLHNNLRSNYLKRGISAGTVRSIQKGKIKQSIFVWLKINLYNQEIPIPSRYLAVARHFGVTDDKKGLELYWNEDTISSAEKKAIAGGLKQGEPYICFAPGAGFFTKRWPKEKYKILADLIQRDRKIKIVVLGGEKDKEIGLFLSNPMSIINLSGQLTLLETAHIISKGKMIVSNDSGLMHMATAVQTPVLAIFGSTVKELGFFPYRADSVVIENSDLSCRPCSHIGRHKCPKDHFKCMEDISVEQVYAELAQFL